MSNLHVTVQLSIISCHPVSHSEPVNLKNNAYWSWSIYLCWNCIDDKLFIFRWTALIENYVLMQRICLQWFLCAIFSMQWIRSMFNCSVEETLTLLISQNKHFWIWVGNEKGIKWWIGAKDIYGWKDYHHGYNLQYMLETLE